MNALSFHGSRTTPHEDNSPPDRNKAQPLPNRTTVPRTIPHQDNSPLGPLPWNKTTHQDQKNLRWGIVLLGSCPDTSFHTTTNITRSSFAAPPPLLSPALIHGTSGPCSRSSELGHRSWWRGHSSGFPRTAASHWHWHGDKTLAQSVGEHLLPHQNAQELEELNSERQDTEVG